MLAGHEERKEGADGEVTKPIKPLSAPHFEGVNLVVDLDKEDYNKGVRNSEITWWVRYFFRKEII